MKDIKGYEGLYAVTSCGRVWSYKTQKFLKPRFDKDNYLRVTLSKDGTLKTFHIHRLVAEAYLPKPGDNVEVNHKSEVKTQNWMNNLEWITHYANVNYGTRNERARATRNDTGVARKTVYCLELNETFSSMTEAAAKTSVAQADISRCCNGKRNSAGGYHWQFVA